MQAFEKELSPLPRLPSKEKKDLLDAKGFRPNVGMVLCNRRGELLLFKRYKQLAWQFPQGGIDGGETPLEAMYRELFEEVGIRREQTKLLGQTKGWMYYHLPKWLIRRSDGGGAFVGQKQKWFLLECLAPEAAISLVPEGGMHQEFDGYRWVPYWYPLREIVNFKRNVYSKMLGELAPIFIEYLSKENNREE